MGEKPPPITPPAQAAEHQPFIRHDQTIAEFTVKSVIIGVFFGLIFGASTVYLALKAGLTVSASIPIAVLSISLLKKLGGSTILENNIVQTIGSAGESIAAGVVFTLPGFLFLARGQDGASVGASYFNYWTIFTLALLGGALGVLMMIPLRRALIVNEHGNLPYPEGTACASVLIAGEKGGDLAKTAFLGLGIAFVYATLQKILLVVRETVTYVSAAKSKVFPAATVSADITPEYLGVGYIIGPRISAILVAGGVLAWLGLIPLLASLVPADMIAAQLVKLGEIKDVTLPGKFGWDPVKHEFAALNMAVYRAYVRQIGAGAVAAGGFMTLIKTLPTIVSSFKGSLASIKSGSGAAVAAVKRTERDLPLSVVLIGSVVLVAILAFLPFIPGTLLGKILLGILIVVFGFFFVTVASRIVGIIGSSSNPISGMTIATLMATCLIFVGIGWTGDLYQPMALCVGGMVCIAAANAGATSQDLKTGFLVGATPKYQQIGLMFGAVAAAAVIGLTINVLDNPHLGPDGTMVHNIGEKYAAPQATLMATLIKGLLAQNLDWQFVLVGVFLAVTIQLCGVSPLSFAVGAYLPLSTTLPIFAGGMLKGLVDWRQKKKGAAAAHGDDELGPGSLFSTGLVAGGALAGVVVAALQADDTVAAAIGKLSLEHNLTGALGDGGYSLLGVGSFLVLCTILYRVAMKPMKS
ncbi:MAG: OPT/YSL family transporter [Planctomycetota bacterium]